MNPSSHAQWQNSQHQCLCKGCCSLFLWGLVSPHLAGKTWSHSNDLWRLKPAAFPFCLSESQTCHCFKKLLGSCLDEFEGQLGKLNLSIFWSSSDRQPQTVPQLSAVCSGLCLGPTGQTGFSHWTKWESYHFHGSLWEVHLFCYYRQKPSTLFMQWRKGKWYYKWNHKNQRS